MPQWAGGALEAVGALTPSDQRDFPQHMMPCSAIKPRGCRLAGAPLAQKLAGHQFVVFLGFGLLFLPFPCVVLVFLFICFWVLFCFNLVKLLLSQPTSVLPIQFSPPGLGSE